MKKKLFIAHTIEVVIIIDIFLFIYSNFFGSLYDYGEVKNILLLIQQNWLNFAVLFISIVILFVLHYKGVRTNIKVESIILAVAIILWLAVIFIVAIAQIDLENSKVLFTIFSVLTSINVFYGFRRFGITAF